MLFVSPFKNSVLLLDILIGYEDPNFVKIKQFYEPSCGFNYMAMLAKDSSSKVREIFYGVLETWILELKDREEHIHRFLPYIISGLFDEDVSL